MKLNITAHARYTLVSACNCPKASETACGINYRQG
jgi:hypothetical protein